MLRELNREMAESAHTEDRDTLSRLDAAVLHRAVDRDAGAEQRRGFRARQRGTNPQDVRRLGLHELRITAVDARAGNRLVGAEVLFAFPAQLALAARPVRPGDADAVADLQLVHVRATLDDAPDDFVPGDQRQLDDPLQLLPIAFGDVEIGVANAACFDADQHLVAAGRRSGSVSNCERLFESFDDRSFDRAPRRDSCDGFPRFDSVDARSLDRARRFRMSTVARTSLAVACLG